MNSGRFRQGKHEGTDHHGCEFRPQRTELYDGYVHIRAVVVSIRIDPMYVTGMKPVLIRLHAGVQVESHHLRHEQRNAPQQCQPDPGHRPSITSLTEEQLRKMIEEAGRVPCRRDASYKLLEELATK